MDRDFFRSILPLVNDHKAMDLLQTYAKARIAQIREQMDGLETLDQLRKAQGQILELKRIATLRAEVTERAK